MSGISNYYEDKILDHMLRAQAFSPPATIYASLHTGDPGENGTSNTVSIGRQAISFGASSSGVITSTGNVDFTNMPAVGGVGVTHIALWDAAGSGNPPTGGNCLWKGALSLAVTVLSGETLRLTAVTVTLT